MTKQTKGRAAVLAAMPGDIQHLTAVTGMHEQSVRRYVDLLMLAKECHVSGLTEPKRGRQRYIYAAGAPGPDAIQRTKAVAKKKPERPKRDPLTAALFGPA